MIGDRRHADERRGDGAESPAAVTLSPPAGSRFAGVRRRVFARRVENGVVARAWNSPLRAPALAVLLLGALTMLVFRRQLFAHWTFPWDFLGAYTTTPAFVAASVSAGHLFSWSPYVASGFPVAVDPQAGAYFPGWWLLGLLNIPATLRVLTVVQVAHVLFGSLGVLALARVRRLGWSWAAFAAVAYLFFGGFYGEAEHADMVRGFAYLPWLLWALTPPRDGRRWLRLIALPPLAWLISTGSYPGQMVAFALVGFVYLAVALWVADGGVLRREGIVLGLAVFASAGVCLAALLPYLHAEGANELHRVFEPTATARAGESMELRGLLGLYLNNFSWMYDGTVTAWAVGIPVLIGLACVRLRTVRAHAPLVACGAAALLLAMTPKIGFVGRAMASVRPLFPGRLPAAEYKAVVAVALVVLAADGWSRLASSPRRVRPGAAVLALLLVLGALLVSTRYGSATGGLWLVLLVVAASLALVWLRPSPQLLVILLIGLVVVDGLRVTHAYKLLGRISSWQVSSAEAAEYLGRDGDARKLAQTLQRAPVTRPARIPPVAPLSSDPTGSNQDASGWVADGYHLVDYGGTIERSLWTAEHNPALLTLLLEPWHAYTFPCASAGCSETIAGLPSPSKWRPSAGVHTLSYGTDSITYAVDVARPELMVENELNVSGWHANTGKVRLIDAGTPLRAWRLSPGSYTFTASYREPEKVLQEVLVVVVLLAWLGAFIALWRKPKRQVG
jgi:hypothetical protein